jgi:hypothetical protein
VILVDDLIATGGTAEGAVKLLTQMGADIVAACFVIDLPDLGGRAKLEALGVEVNTLIALRGPLAERFVPPCVSSVDDDAARPRDRGGFRIGDPERGRSARAVRKTDLVGHSRTRPHAAVIGGVLALLPERILFSYRLHFSILELDRDRHLRLQPSDR